MDHHQMLQYDSSQILQDIRGFLTIHPDGMIAIYGQTATGKTALSVELAKHLPIEVISADSRQIYRHMDIGTDKISTEIRSQIPHHLIDIVDPDEIYTAWDRQNDTHRLIWEIQTRGHIPLIVWGTGLYIDMVYHNFWLPDVPPDYEYRATIESHEAASPWYCHELLTKLDPLEAARHHPHSLRFIIRALEMIHVTGRTKAEITSSQPPIRPLMMIGLRRDAASGDALINNRIIHMMEWVFIDEVRRLISLWYTSSLLTKKPNAYPIALWYLVGDYDLQECITRMQVADRRLAKKQRTWFRRYLRDSEGFRFQSKDIRDSQTSRVVSVVYQNYWVN